MNKQLDMDPAPSPSTLLPRRDDGSACLKWLLAAWLLGSLLFAHGCHGPDEDHELFTALVAWIAR